MFAIFLFHQIDIFELPGDIVYMIMKILARNKMTEIEEKCVGLADKK